MSTATLQIGVAVHWAYAPRLFTGTRERMRRNPHLPPPQDGLTLIEVLITLLVLAIIASIAVPSFAGMLARNRVSASANELLATLHFARAESIRRNQPVRLCASADGLACAGQDWNRWIVRTAAGEVVREGTVPPQVVVVAAGAFAAGGMMAPDGALHGGDGTIQAGSLDFCDRDDRARLRMWVEGGVHIRLDPDVQGLCA